jgi:hypothetical protein
MIELVESLKNFPLEKKKKEFSIGVPQGAITFLQGTPTSLDDLIGTLGLRLAYFPLTNNMVSLGEGESSPRGEGRLYILAWLLV